jgi:hypothetical protein
MVFADPPDNIGLGYDEYSDRRKESEYLDWLADCVLAFMAAAPIIWISFNARWTVPMGRIVDSILTGAGGENWEVKPCVQTFTFGQHNHRDLGNNHRPLWRIMRRGTSLYPDAIRVPSWRQQNGDKRADPRGRVPGDVLDFPRVTGNSKQRRSWHATQLHEGLVERCIKMSTRDGDHVVDPFGGTGTTLRVCKAINRRCTLIELSRGYCEKIAVEHGLEISRIPQPSAA